MIPVLEVISDGAVHVRRELFSRVASSVGLSAEQLRTTLASGQYIHENRIGWALSYLSRIGALERPARGRYRITLLGRQLLSDYPAGISEAELRRYASEGDSWWVNRAVTSSPAESVTEQRTVEASQPDPQQQVEEGIARIHDSVKAELLSRLLGQEPAFFEQAVVKLLLAMGYGGTNGAAAVTGMVHDGGIDGVIDQDVLGLRQVYVQAKRYGVDNVVQRPAVQAFVGALSGKADQGVFITTSRFSPGAIEYAERDARARVILVDGQRLTDLMVRYEVGVQVQRVVRIVEIDEDFFE